MSKIYIACPAYVKTGGTELLHQFFYELDSIAQIKVFLYYYDRDSKIEAQPTPPSFLKYIENDKIVYEVEDHKKNFIIIPEVASHLINQWSQISMMFWWLSVDNFYLNLGLKSVTPVSIKEHVKKLLDMQPYNRIRLVLSNKIKYHLCQSYYAYSHLNELGLKNTLFLSDYINDSYQVSESDLSYERLDIVLYNPYKGWDFTKEILESGKLIQFKPIVGLSNDEVHAEMLRSKVYIDFGNHPGKDRIPREAVLSGCCLITSLNGSAKNSYDIPIDSKYKIHRKEINIPLILKLIDEIFKNFELHQSNFNNYRKIIQFERNNFKKEISDLLSIIHHTL